MVVRMAGGPSSGGGPPEQVFVVAPHRSGTTILCRLLAASGCFNVVTAFHVLNRHRLRELHSGGRIEEARAALNRELVERKVTDEYGAPVTADHPEEYAYVLSKQGRRPILTPENVESLRRFCRDVREVQDPLHPLLLKNPFDTSNFLFVRDCFPRARFILLHRNPLEVIDSQLRLVRWMFAERSAYDAMIVERYRTWYDSPWRRALARLVVSERGPVLIELVSRRIFADCDYAVRHAASLGTAAMSITYPDLCANPDEAIHRLLSFLGLSDDGGRQYAAMIAPRGVRLTAEVERRRDRLERRTAAYRRMFGV